MVTKTLKCQSNLFWRFLGILLAVTVFLTSIFIPKDVFGADVTTYLSPQIKLYSEGNELTERSQINGKKEITMEINFDVPVQSDTPAPANPIRNGDIARIEIVDRGLQVTSTHPMPNPLDILIDKKDGSGGKIKLGEAKFVRESDGKIFLEVKFTDDPANPTVNIYDDYEEVKAKFSASFKLDLNSEQGHQGGTTTIKILDKIYNLVLKKPNHDLGLTKDAVIIPSEQAIEWTVTATSDSGLLNGYTLEDDLTDVGEYIEDSFKFDYQEEGTSTTYTVQPTDSPYDSTTKILSYTFEKDAGRNITSPVIIKFKTKIPDDKFVAFEKLTYTDIPKSKPAIITNKVKLKDGNTVKKEADKTVTWSPKWIKKELQQGNTNNYYSKVGSDYFVTWKVTANEEKAKLKNAKLKEELREEVRDTSDQPTSYKLEYYEAELKIYDKNDSIVSTKNFAKTASGSIQAFPANYEFDLGDIEGKVELEIKARVKNPDSDFDKFRKRILNKVGLRWDNNNNTDVKTVDESNIGKYTIEKKLDNSNDTYACVQLSASRGVWQFVNFETKWLVQVNNVDPTTKVYDMLIFDNSVNYDILYRGNQQGEFTLENNTSTQISGIDLKDLLPVRYGFRRHKYHGYEQPGGETNVNVIVHKLHYKGKYVGDLLEMTGFDMSTMNKRRVYIKTSLEDKEALVNNVSDPIDSDPRSFTVASNTVHIIQNNKIVDTDTHWPRYISRMLEKEAFSREDAQTFAASKTAANANKPNITDLGRAFNYKEKTAMYRLSINANKVHDLGDLVAKDILPAGWELKEYTIFEGKSEQESIPNAHTDSNIITNRADYLKKIRAGVEAQGAAILTGTGDDDTSSVVKVKYNPAASIADSGDVVFTFKDISKPYVIILEAKVSDEKFKEYVANPESRTVQNDAELYLERNIENKVGKNQKIKIDPKITFKKHQLTTPAVLKWHVDYVPQNVVTDTTVTLEDKIGYGMELRKGADKNSLIFQEGSTKNFQIFEITLNADGTVTEGTEVSDIAQYIIYDEDTRLLKFKVPENNGQKAYRFYYLTDLSGNVGFEIINKVTLKAETPGSNYEAKDRYVISSASASAIASKSAFIEITKKDADGNKLEGATFNLRNKPDTTAYDKNFTSDERGRILIAHIPNGNYTLTEVSAPSGYRRTSQVYNVTVTQVGIVRIAKILEKNGVEPGKIEIINEKGTPPNPPGGRDPDPKPPTPPAPETPPTPETPPIPENPPTPPTPPDIPNVPNIPRFPPNEIPDPNDPGSPPEITIIGEDGVPLGNYRKQQKPDGTYEYVLMDEDVPLAGVLPKTGENGAYMCYAGGLFLVLAGAALVIAENHKKKLQK